MGFLRWLLGRGPRIEAHTLGVLDLSGGTAGGLMAADRAALAPLFRRVSESTDAPPRSTLLLVYCTIAADGAISTSPTSTTARASPARRCRRTTSWSSSSRRRGATRSARPRGSICGAPRRRSSIVDVLAARFGDHRLLCAIQVHETVEPASLAELTPRFDWSALRVYHLNAPAENHGVLLGTRGWAP